MKGLHTYYHSLYHNKRLQGTTTSFVSLVLFIALYHNKRLQGTTTILKMASGCAMIIPQQETSGNYNHKYPHLRYLLDYTTTRDFRELQQPEFIGFSMENYTTTIDFSELQFVSERKAPQGKRLHGL